jgi:hypothetical protein
VGPDATTFSEPCEACLQTRESISALASVVEGTLRREADVGFTTCRRGHRIIVRRVRLRALAGAR